MRRRDFLTTAVAAGLAGTPPRTAARAQADPTTSPAGTAKHKPRILFFHDGRHPLIYMYEPPIQKEEYEAAVDELAGTTVDALMFCLGDGRTMLHDTKVGELWGHNVKKWPLDRQTESLSAAVIVRRAHQNAQLLIEAGKDPLRIICDRAHAKGLLIYPTLLVQNSIGVGGEEDTRVSDFRLKNRHLEIGARGGIDPSYPKAALTCLDFKHPEVREERFALIQETLTRYPVDGFELQLGYVPYYFRPDEVDEGRRIMTTWIARIYRAVKENGSDRELAIRVPASIEGCFSVGLDVREWIRQGIVDMLIGQTFSDIEFELVDQGADFRPLVLAAQGKKCQIFAAVKSQVDSDRLAEAPIEMVRATACNYWTQGVDGLYLAHWFGNWPYQASFYEKLRELPHADVMATKDKFYFVPTATGDHPELAKEPSVTMQLPTELKVNKPVAIEFSITDDLPRWQKVGRVHQVLLRVRILETTELDRLHFRLNGRLLPDSLLRKLNEMYKMSAPRYRVFGYWFIYTLNPDHWPQQGKNTLEVTLLERDPDVTLPIVLRDVELETKYLMGKNFRRGEDPDVGRYDCSVG